MKALLLVDLQNDFFPGGSLGVDRGDEIIPTINKLLQMDWGVVAASKDWHPYNHESFASRHEGKKVGDIIKLNGLTQILWPDHCIEGTKGAEFYPGWDTALVDKIFFKGVDPKMDSYSTFFDNGHRRSTGLADFLKDNNIKDIYIAGLATDYCVKASALDALDLGFNTYVVLEGVRGVNLQPEDSKKAFSEMEKKGAIPVSVNSL